jgi:CRISPR-associated exonuclease Cas4
MEPIIAISTINDFLFCPRSLYLHMAAGELDASTYHAAPQVNGKARHDAIDNKRYSNRKNILQGMSIYSEKLQVQGKLDTFNTETGELIERKALLHTIYSGYYMQLYAEYFCLVEMGYQPKSLAFYSIENNKRYSVPAPGETEKNRLKKVIADMQNFNTEKLLAHHCPNCDNNIYAPLGW